MDGAPHFRIVNGTVLAAGWGRLTRYDIALRTSRGWREMRREVYDHGDGVACLLHDATADTVLLVRQFRLPAALAAGDGYVIEVPAGLLEGASAEDRMRGELHEETGYRAAALETVATVFTSPGVNAERLTLFLGAYDRDDPLRGAGGGNEEEGEDIEILHIPFATALDMVDSGAICDAKTVILLQHLALRLRA